MLMKDKKSNYFHELMLNLILPKAEQEARSFYQAAKVYFEEKTLFCPISIKFRLTFIYLFMNNIGCLLTSKAKRVPQNP